MDQGILLRQPNVTVQGGLLAGYQSRDGLAQAMPGDCGGQIFKRVAPMHAASLRNGEEAGGGQFAIRAAIAETDLAPLHARSQSPLRAVVGGLHARMFEKGEQPLGMFKQSPRKVLDLSVRTVQVILSQNE